MCAISYDVVTVQDGSVVGLDYTAQQGPLGLTRDCSKAKLPDKLVLNATVKVAEPEAAQTYVKLLHLNRACHACYVSNVECLRRNSISSGALHAYCTFERDYPCVRCVAVRASNICSPHSFLFFFAVPVLVGKDPEVVQGITPHACSAIS